MQEVDRVLELMQVLNLLFMYVGSYIHFVIESYYSCTYLCSFLGTTHSTPEMQLGALIQFSIFHLDAPYIH